MVYMTESVSLHTITVHVGASLSWEQKTMDIHDVSIAAACFIVL